MALLRASVRLIPFRVRALPRAIPQNRYLSKDDTPDLSYKDLQRLFPCDERMVMIVDDRIDVWDKSADSVVRAHPCES